MEGGDTALGRQLLRLTQGLPFDVPALSSHGPPGRYWMSRRPMGSGIAMVVEVEVVVDAVAFMSPFRGWNVETQPSGRHGAAISWGGFRLAPRL